MVKVTKMCSSTVWYNLYCWKMSHCVVLYLYILYMGFCGNGYHPFSKWMILFRGLNCPSSISFVEVSERGLRRLSGALEYICVAPQKTNEKCLKNNLSPRVSCCWAISRGLVSVHINVFSKNPLRFDGLRWREKLTKYNWFYGVDLSWWRYGC